MIASAMDVWVGYTDEEKRSIGYDEPTVRTTRAVGSDDEEIRRPFSAR